VQYIMENKIRIAHEAPMSIFDKVQQLTDYDYCLVHLMDELPEYKELFFKAKEQGREIILDNSIFELGKSFNNKKYYHWVTELEPTWYIIPDVLEDCDKTIDKAKRWLSKYPDIKSKSIGVVQGKTYEEIVKCYKYMVEVAKVDKVAISFDYSYYLNTYENLGENKYERFTIGRACLIDQMIEDEVIDYSVPVHLLGCGLPQEGAFYKEDPERYFFIDSVDTSNPIVHGIKNVQYTKYGLKDKESQKLFTMINYQLNPQIWDLIEYNTKAFKNLWNA